MIWQNELVTSGAEAEAFLKRQLEGLGYSPLEFDVNHKWGLGFTAETKIKDNKERILYFEINADRRNCIWQNIDVEDDFQGNGLGLMVAKCAVGIAYERSINYITLFMVRHDGPGFWPTLGAVPEEAPFNIGGHIEDVIKERINEINPLSLLRLEQIKQVAEENPYAAWRDLSQIYIKFADGKYFTELAFERICTNNNLMLILTDPGTQGILTRRLGVLPDPRPSNHARSTEWIVAQLEQRRQLCLYEPSLVKRTSPLHTARL